MKNFFHLFSASLDYPMNIDLFKFISRLIKILLYEYGIGISVLQDFYGITDYSFSLTYAQFHIIFLKINLYTYYYNYEFNLKKQILIRNALQTKI